MEFDIQNSLLFLDMPRDPPGTETIEEPINIEDSFLFSQPVNDIQLEPSKTRSEGLVDHSANIGAKRVKTLGGKEVFLKKRVRNSTTVDFNDSFLDIDELHARVERRKKFNEALDAVRSSHKKESKQPEIANKNSTHGVWTERYRPKSFFQLCPAGNERQYRHIMHWIRNKEREKKVLLVHGPTGVGKSAAVTLLAHQAGFHVHEVNSANAMEDSGGIEHLKQRMKTAVFTNDVTASSKPTCLVIDEIDCYANSGEVIRAVKDLVTSKDKPVTRPVICIANEAFGKAMEKLRPHCELVGFRRPLATASSGTGSKRRVNVSAQKAVKEFLLEISAAEGLGLDKKEVTDIFETCEGDIRACINHMQFAGRKLDKELFVGSDAVIDSSKDIALSWFTLVDRLFARDQKLTKEEDFSVVFEMLMSGEGKSGVSGLLDKVLGGCFSRYLDATHLQDDSIRRPAEISEWLFAYDRFNRLPNAEMSGYASLTALKFWSLFSEISPANTRENLLLPNARNMDFECYEQKKQNEALIETLSEKVPLQVKLACCGCSGNASYYASEFLPHLDMMLSPPTGSSRVKRTMRPHEQNIIDKIYEVVKKFELRLESNKNVDTGLVSLTFGPNWDPVTNYETDLAPMTLAQKNRIQSTKRQWLFPLVQTEFEFAASAKAKRRLDSTATPVATVKRAKAMSLMDFYGVPKAEGEDGGDEVDVKDEDENGERVRIWVKFHEGFSNAVRKNIGWADLWE